MRATWLRFLAQLGILVAIATSVALLVDTIGVSPAYCSVPAGCHAAKMAARRVLGAVPLPLLSLIAFFGWLVVVTSVRGRWARRLETLGAVVAALTGAALLLVQGVVLKTFCPLCVVVDSLAILVALALLIEQRLTHGAAPKPWLRPAAVYALSLVLGLAPVAWPEFRPAAAVPSALVELASPNRLTVVEFVDLSCSHCRELYPILEQLRGENAERIHFVRLHAPMRGHRQARQAARLLQCLEPDAPRIERLTALLFEAPQLDRDAILGAAESVGMTEDEVNACWADASSETPLDENVQRLEALGFLGLPTTYVAGERIVGAMPKAVYAAAIERASRSKGSVGLETTAFCVLLGLLVLGIVVVGRTARERA